MTTLSITHTPNGTLVESDGHRRRVRTIPGASVSPIDELFTADDPAGLARSWFDAGGDVFYDLVYDAVRPEVFFKATPHRVVGAGAGVRIRRDSTWNVPEP